MKKLFALLVLLVSSIITGYTQDIPEKANTIVVTVSDSNTVREKIVKVLEGKGYTISSGKTAKVISTAARTLKNGTRVTYSIQTKGTEVYIKGFLPVAGQAGTVISYQGKKGTPMANGWEEMTKIAKEFGGPVKYENK